MIKKDMVDIDLNMSDEDIMKTPATTFKQLIKKKVRSLAYTNLEIIKSGHTKVRNIIHNGMKHPQSYLVSGQLSNNQCKLLFNLRSRCVNEFKSNFFPSVCMICKLNPDTQEHALLCQNLQIHLKQDTVNLLPTVTYNDIFSDTHSQLNISKVYQDIIQTRERLRTSTLDQAYPGRNTGPGG